MKIKTESSLILQNLVDTISKNEETNFYRSYEVLEATRKVNILFTTCLIVFGLIGNALIIYVFSKKRYRINPSNVFLLCLAINDSFFLIIHFFEDTVRTYTEMFILSNNSSYNSALDDFIEIINLTDRFTFSCLALAFLRYVLRFVSAYIIVAFTIQRLLIVILPLNNTFKSKKLAWLSVLGIFLISILFNSWVPIMFEIQTWDELNFCEIKENLKPTYFMITNVYVFLVVIIPIIIILCGNILIIVKTKQADQRRQKIQAHYTLHNLKRKTRMKRPKSMYNLASPEYGSFTSKRNSIIQIDSQVSRLTENNLKHRSENNTKVITKLLLLISFSYALLNLPYLVTWCLFYKEITHETKNSHEILIQNYLFVAVQICEIFYVLNYGLHFYFYCLSSSKFWNQLKETSNFFNLNYIYSVYSI
jgi:hypothetical protein